MNHDAYKFRKGTRLRHKSIGVEIARGWMNGPSAYKEWLSKQPEFYWDDINGTGICRKPQC